MRLFYLLLIPLCWSKCPCDTVCDETFKRCYKHVNRGQSYFDAEEDCMSLGGHLASVENVFENAVIGESADSMFAGYNDYWIGANYIIENKWSWTDGTTWSYINWFPEEPSEQTVVSVLLKGHMWTTSNPDNSKPYVCEMPYSSGGVTVSKPPLSILATAAPSPTCAHIPHCESTWTYYAGADSCYKVQYNEAFYDAEHVCNSLGAHMSSIHSQEENNFIADLATLGRPVAGTDSTWIGLYQKENQWYWTDGSEASFFAWGPWTSAGTTVLLYPWGYPGLPEWYNKWDAVADYEKKLRNFVCKKPAL